MDHEWIYVSAEMPLPHNAVIAGHDSDGTPIYVGRSLHEGDYLPAKVVPSKGLAYVAWAKQEHEKTQYEVLVGDGYAWAKKHGGSVPPRAVSTGTTDIGEPLYVGRGFHADSLCVGKVHPSHGCLYIPFGGEEISLDDYEVLVRY